MSDTIDKQNKSKLNEKEERNALAEQRATSSPHKCNTNTN